MSSNPTPLMKIEQSLLCTGSSTQGINVTPQNRGVPLTTRQPAEYSWMSGNPTPLMEIRQSLLYTGSSTQGTLPVPTIYNDHTGSTCEQNNCHLGPCINTHKIHIPTKYITWFKSFYITLNSTYIKIYNSNTCYTR